MRSLLFAPGDSPGKLEKAFRSGADAIIIDLEDSVARNSKGAARVNALAFLRERRGESVRPRLYVRVNSLDSGLSDGDLDVVMTASPDGIVLPKSAGGPDVTRLDSRLSLREALHGVVDGTVSILPIATETAAAVFLLGSYAGCSRRLAAITWGAEDLSVELGALRARVGSAWASPFALVRSLCLFGAAAAGVAAIDTVYTDLHDTDALRDQCLEGLHDGFSGKLAIHPSQVPVINDAFTPGAEALDQARRVLAAFAQAEGQGVTALDGRMLDEPHRRAALRLLARSHGAS